MQRKIIEKTNIVRLEQSSMSVPVCEPKTDLLATEINNMPIAILIFDLQAKVIAENQYSQRLFSSVSLLGRCLLDLDATFEYDDRTALSAGQCPVRCAIETRQSVENVLMVIPGTPTTEKRWLLINASPRFYANGEFLQVICCLQDVSQLKRTEATYQDHFLQTAIQRGKQEWTATVDAIPDMIIFEDAEGCLLRCNKATANFFKLPYTKILSKNLISLFFKGQHNSLFKSPFRGDTTQVQFAGREGWFEVINYPVPAEAGLPCRWVHIIKDITLQKRSEAMLQQLHTVIEQAAESIIITEPTGMIQYVNATFEEMTGWSSSEVKGRHFLTLGGQTSKLMFYREAIEALSTGQIWRGVHKARRKNGSFYEEETTISPVKDLSGNLLNYIAVSRDVTERKRLEAIAEAVNMTENVGYVFSGIRHELGNPINSIKTALSVLSNNIDQWPRGQVIKYLNRTLTEIRRVEYLLKALKTFNMHENPKMQSVDLIFFIESLLQLIEKDFIKRGISVSTSLDSNISKCNADPRALHQVFLNLLANAADALTEKSDPTIFISINKLGKMIQIKIIDNGIGMDENQQRNIFKPFFTSKPSGTGLGLVIVKKMLAKMNGTISIKSELDAGTEVTLLLEAING